MQRILKISGHCQDRFTARLDNKEYGPNYVPTGLGIGGGDDISLQIDIETGQILNWKKPDAETLNEIFPDPTPTPKFYRNGEELTENDMRRAIGIVALTDLKRYGRRVYLGAVYEYRSEE